jgi:hypothetical protein
MQGAWGAQRRRCLSDLGGLRVAELSGGAAGAVRACLGWVVSADIHPPALERVFPTSLALLAVERRAHVNVAIFSLQLWRLPLSACVPDAAGWRSPPTITRPVVRRLPSCDQKLSKLRQRTLTERLVLAVARTRGTPATCDLRQPYDDVRSARAAPGSAAKTVLSSSRRR